MKHSVKWSCSRMSFRCTVDFVQLFFSSSFKLHASVGTSGCSYFSHFVSSYCAFGIFLIEICIFAGETRPDWEEACSHAFSRILCSCNTRRKVQLPINVHGANTEQPANECRVQCSGFAHLAAAAIPSTRAIYIDV